MRVESDKTMRRWRPDSRAQRLFLLVVLALAGGCRKGAPPSDMEAARLVEVLARAVHDDLRDGPNLHRGQPSGHSTDAAHRCAA